MRFVLLRENNGAGDCSPAPVFGHIAIALEHVAQCKLDYAPRPVLAEGRLRAGELSESRRRCASEDERICVQAGAVEAREPLRVSEVEDFPTESQCLAFPRH